MEFDVKLSETRNSYLFYKMLQQIFNLQVKKRKYANLDVERASKTWGLIFNCD